MTGPAIELRSKGCDLFHGIGRGIENALHRQLDVPFREDAARERKDNGPANIAILRRRALDVSRRDTSKGSLSIRLKRAGWDDVIL